MKQKKITVILPIHKIDEDYKVMFENAVKSVEQFYGDVVLSIVCPNDILKDIKEVDLGQKLEVVYLGHNDTPTFTKQVNLGIEKCDTEWFSILEVDDEYKSIWLKSMFEHVAEYTDVDVFLPIVKDINPDGKFTSFTNEANWAYGFTEKQGFLDNEVLLEFQNYQISGGLYKTSVIKEMGKFKENIKLTFPYEFLLRLTHNGVKILTVPRIGYQHVNFREDSLFWKYKNDEKEKLNEKEVKFWLETAKKEFFFKNNREINYVES